LSYINLAGKPALSWSDREQLCARRGCLVITPLGEAYPHTDDGVEVRRLLHTTRSIAIENFHEQTMRATPFLDAYETTDTTQRVGTVQR